MSCCLVPAQVQNLLLAIMCGSSVIILLLEVMTRFVMAAQQARLMWCVLQCHSLRCCSPTARGAAASQPVLQQSHSLCCSMHCHHGGKMQLRGQKRSCTALLVLPGRHVAGPCRAQQAPASACTVKAMLCCWCRGIICNIITIVYYAAPVSSALKV